MRTPTGIRWRIGKIRELDGEALLCRIPMRKRVKAQKVDVIVAGKAKGIAWGQFLDADHHSGTHWGRFGTSAAVQVLAMDLHWSPHDAEQRSVRDLHPVNRIAEFVLPETRPPLHPAESGALNGESPETEPGPGTTGNIEASGASAIHTDLKPDDFRDPMKVAFVVDAAVPDACDDPVQGRPDVVELLLELAVDQDGWSTRPKHDLDHLEKDRLLITAYALYVLRRFPAAQTDARIAGAWTWLALEVIDGAKTMGEDLLALSCLALCHAIPQVRNETVDDAFAKGSSELVDWARKSRDPVVTRFYFNGYSRGADNDYIFLSPELVCALLFLTMTQPRRAALRFALDVVRAVADNIVPRDLPEELRGNAHGFTIQRGMEGTVDQMWALRLLRTFHHRYTRGVRELRPSRVSWPSIAFGSLILSTAGVLLAALGGFGDGLGETLGIAFGSAMFGAAAGAILPELRDRRQ